MSNSELNFNIVNDFHGRTLPEAAIPVGYAAIIQHFNLAVPLPRRLSAIAARRNPVSNASWQLLTPRHRPSDTLAGQLIFALKWEGVDLAVLAALFKAVEPDAIAAIVRATPTGAFARRVWYLFEWLTLDALDVPDPGKVRAVAVIDPDRQVARNSGAVSTRHKVIDNLPGGRAFCPMVTWTPALKAAAAKRLDATARETIGRTRRDLVTRAAAFLLLHDSKSSFAIEGEQPSSARTTRWAHAIAEAGAQLISVQELARLQRLVIGDARFVTLGLRHEGGFVGTHDRETQEPIPDHISARPQDLLDLLEGLVEYDARSISGGVDPVAAAAAMSFGFVYIHPFADGNGRLHRWLIHHTLARTGYNPLGIVFPISSAILRRIDEYRSLLESYSRALLPLVSWRATADGNLDVLNETIDYYRYFDATRHAEFLYSCVEQTVTQDLPDEVHFLEAFDAFSSAVKGMVDMPDRKIEQLRRFLAQGHGRLSTRARESEFKALTDEETTTAETLYLRLFNASNETPDTR